MIVLDGAMGTRLEAMGHATPPPLWSAQALIDAPDAVAAVHRAYAEAGATVHTACTFRTQPRHAPRWRELAATAVRLARDAVPAGHRVAGSVAPLEDCWSPERSPADPGPEHARLARHLADCGVDLLLCETFAHVGEALAAVEAAVATGVETWVSFTPGYRADLLTPDAIRAGAAAAIDHGAAAVLVNCVPAGDADRYVAALVGLGAPFGVYANAGGDAIGRGGVEPEAYARLAAGWRAAGATIVGGCCGTGPGHIAAVARVCGS